MQIKLDNFGGSLATSGPTLIAGNYSTRPLNFFVSAVSAATSAYAGGESMRGAATDHAVRGKSSE